MPDPKPRDLRPCDRMRSDIVAVACNYYLTLRITSLMCAIDGTYQGGMAAGGGRNPRRHWKRFPLRQRTTSSTVVTR